MLSKVIAAITSGSAAALSSVEGINTAIMAAGANALKGVYADAFRVVYLVSIVFGGKWIREIKVPLLRKMLTRSSHFNSCRYFRSQC